MDDDRLDGPVRARARDRAGSHMAASAAKARAPSMREALLIWFRAHPEARVIRDQIPIVTGVGRRDKSSARSRIADLIEMGELVNTQVFQTKDGTSHEVVSLAPPDHPRQTWQEAQESRRTAKDESVRRQIALAVYNAVQPLEAEIAALKARLAASSAPRPRSGQRNKRAASPAQLDIFRDGPLPYSLFGDDP